MKAVCLAEQQQQLAMVWQHNSGAVDKHMICTFVFVYSTCSYIHTFMPNDQIRIHVHTLYTCTHFVCMYVHVCKSMCACNCVCLSCLATFTDSPSVGLPQKKLFYQVATLDA